MAIKIRKTELTEEQKQLLVEHRCFKCKQKKVKTKIPMFQGYVDSWKCEVC